MQNLTWDQIGTFVLVLGAILAAYNLIHTAMKNRRENETIRNQPLADLTQRVDAQAAMLDRDKRHFEKLDEIIERQQKQLDRMDDGINLLMRSTLELVRHDQHGNNIDGLRRVESDIMDYLTKATAPERRQQEI